MLWKSLFRAKKSRSPRSPRSARRLQMESLEGRRVFAAAAFDAGYEEPIEEPPALIATLAGDLGASDSSASQADSPAPVLMVISNQDFWYQDYADTRAALEFHGLEVVVAAATTETAKPHANSGQGSDGGFVRPDLALTDVEAEDYSAIVFSGGWGMASYQYGFEGTYDNSAYRGSAALKATVNDLINDFVEQDKHVGAVCYGVSVLAYARVDGESLLEHRTVTGWNGAAPSADGARQDSRTQVASNGAEMLMSGEIGDPTTSSDDVYIDGNIITAENFHAATAFGDAVAREVIAAHEDAKDAESSEVKPVLMVIANQDFYHREYFETRESLEAAGLEVVVAAATTETATPHAISVVEGREPNVTPDIALADVSAEDYSTLIFVGGYGAAGMQYAHDGQYDYAPYNGSAELKEVVNDLINDFVDQDKYLAAICNGVTVLAWARVDGASPIDGHNVTAWAHHLPSVGGETQWTRDHIELNGGTQLESGEIGDPTTSSDDVIVDGNIITAENYDSAYAFGRKIAEVLLEG